MVMLNVMPPYKTTKMLAENLDFCLKWIADFFCIHTFTVQSAGLDS